MTEGDDVDFGMQSGRGVGEMKVAPVACGFCYFACGDGEQCHCRINIRVYFSFSSEVLR